MIGTTRSSIVRFRDPARSSTRRPLPRGLAAGLLIAALALTACSSGSASSAPSTAATAAPSSQATASAAVVEPTTEASPSSAPCSAIDTIKVSIFAGNIQALPAWVARDEGIFAANCLEMVEVPITSSPNGLAQAVTGEIDFVIGPTDLSLVSKQNGLDIRIVASFGERIGNALVASKGTALANEAAGFPANMKDLVGKTVGVTALNSGTQTSTQALLQAAGLDPSAATFVATGAGATQIAAVQNGAVNFAMMPGNGPEIVVSLGAGKIIADPRMPGDWGPTINSLVGTTIVYSATKAFLDAHSDVAKRFAKANHEAIAFATDPANRDKVFAIAQKYAPIKDVPNADQVLSDALDIRLGGMKDTISRKSIAGWNAFTKSLGQIKEDVPFEDIVWDGSSDYFAP